MKNYLQKLNGALAKNTIRAYRSDYNDYAKWCLKQGVEPLNENPQQMYAYIENLAHTCAVPRQLIDASRVYLLFSNF